MRAELNMVLRGSAALPLNKKAGIFIPAF